MSYACKIFVIPNEVRNLAKILRPQRCTGEKHDVLGYACPGTSSRTEYIGYLVAVAVYHTA